MAQSFIQPNWHVIAIHFPLGLLATGVVLEWISLCWPKSAIRIGGRWMMLMGALLSVPALAMGLYAFRHEVAPHTTASNWYQVIQQSPWSAVQWDYLGRHIWFESIGSAAAVAFAVLWLALSDDGRRKLYWPGLIAITIALALMVVGAWYSGEAVYRYGTAVAAVTAQSSANQTEAPAEPDREPATPEGRYDQEESEPAAAGVYTGDRQAGHQHEGHEHDAHEHSAWVRRYFPPMQVHLLMASGVIGFALAAVGLSIRRWSRPTPGPGPAGSPAAVRVAEGTPPAESAEMRGQPVAPPPATLAPAAPLQPIFPARFWLVAFIFSILATLAGLWMTWDWDLDAFSTPWQKGDISTSRVFWHIIFAASIIVCAIILAITTRVSRRAKAITVLFIIILLAAMSLQVWFGILMLYDSPNGPWTGFATGV